MSPTEQIAEAEPTGKVWTANEVYDIARRGALSALVDAGVIEKKAMALALVNGTVPGVELKTADQVTPAGKLKTTANYAWARFSGQTTEADDSAPGANACPDGTGQSLERADQRIARP